MLIYFWNNGTNSDLKYYKLSSKNYLNIPFFNILFFNILNNTTGLNQKKKKIQPLNVFNFTLFLQPPFHPRKNGKISVAITPSPNNSACIVLNCASGSDLVYLGKGFFVSSVILTL